MAKILIVDDDTVNSQLFVNKFSSDGHTVVFAEDGEVGLRHTTTFFDLIILDVMVPKADGLTILKKIRIGTNKRTPVVIFTNLVDETVKKEAIEAGAAEYLIKADYTPQAFIEKINKYLATSH